MNTSSTFSTDSALVAHVCAMAHSLGLSEQAFCDLVTAEDFPTKTDLRDIAEGLFWANETARDELWRGVGFCQGVASERDCTLAELLRAENLFYPVEIAESLNGYVPRSDEGWRAELEVALDPGELPAARIDVRVRHTSENATPMDVYHGLRFRWSARAEGSGCVSVERLEALATEIRPCLRAVEEGHTVEWDGQNYVGRLTEDAQIAAATIEEIIDGWDWTDGRPAMDAGDFVFDDGTSLETLLETLKLRRGERDIHVIEDALMGYEDIVLYNTRMAAIRLVDELVADDAGRQMKADHAFHQS